MRIGFIGTGTMGTPIARCLVAAGHQLTPCDLHALDASVSVARELRD